MYYQEDWLLHQIELLGLFFRRLLKGYKDEQMPMYEWEQISLTQNTVYQKVYTLIGQNKICEAENFIYEILDSNNENGDAIEAAILFYYKISKLTDLELEKFNFSRSEIFSGLIEISQICNLDGLFIYGDNPECDSETDAPRQRKMRGPLFKGKAALDLTFPMPLFRYCGERQQRPHICLRGRKKAAGELFSL